MDIIDKDHLLSKLTSEQVKKMKKREYQRKVHRLKESKKALMKELGEDVQFVSMKEEIKQQKNDMDSKEKTENLNPFVIPSDQRDSKGRFLPNNNFKRGTRNPYRRMLQSIPEHEFLQITTKLLDLAKKGDLDAASLIFKYVMPHEKVAPNPEPLPIKIKTTTADELSESMDVVIESMSEGEISLEGGRDYISALNVKREFIQTAFVEDKIKNLKDRMEAVGR